MDLGDVARGSLAKRMIRPKLIPPATRKVSPREIVQVLGNPDQVGYPASMDADACLGYSVTGYQSWDVFYDHCEAWKRTLVRLEGRLPKGHEDKAKDGLCQEARVGQEGHVAPGPHMRQFLSPTRLGLWIP